jgi:hypothetical protein
VKIFSADFSPKQFDGMLFRGIWIEVKLFDIAGQL